jgi:hypothetical protein
MARPRRPLDGGSPSPRFVVYLANKEDLAHLETLLRKYPALSLSDVLRSAVRHAVQTMTVARPRADARPVPIAQETTP